MIAQAGLRERKKARTRAAIRQHALRLFREHGYQATTVEQIAAAAEVSPSTFFRYFPTKEDVVLRDDLDTRMLEAFSRQPPGLAPVPAIRAAIKESLSSFGDDEMIADPRDDAADAGRPGDQGPRDGRVRPDDRGDRRGDRQGAPAGPRLTWPSVPCPAPSSA